ncbi:MAG TPA: calcium-binding protein, partial [Actinoplanes sp.]|nr:calcium-binding protein [Actinoplanes sp.]
LSIASPALAAAGGTAKVSGSTVIYTAKAGVANNAVVTRSGNVVTIKDQAGVTAGAGCRAVRGDVKRVRCTTSGKPKLVKVTLGDENDTFEQLADIAATVSAGTGDDTLDGGPKADTLLGGEGNDSLTGGSGDDTLDGGLGRDTMNGGSGRDVVTYATRSASVEANLSFTEGNAGEPEERDTIAGNVEDLVGGSGADNLRGNALKNRIDGGPGNDYIFGTPGKDELLGGAGDDTISSDARGAKLNGGPGKDELRGGAASDILDGGPDDDLLRGWLGADTLIGGSGFDTSTYYKHPAAVIVDIDGAKGDDGAPDEGDTTATDIEKVVGSHHDDQLTGGNGNDHLDGYFGNDRLNGGGGDDTLYGDYGTDRLNGGDGNDTLDGAGEADVMIGGAGRDMVSYADRWETVQVNLARSGPGDGELEENDDIAADVEGVTGGHATDYLTGNAKRNRLNGGPGSDFLDGGAGKDVLNGDAGGDTIGAGDGGGTINGGADTDLLVGGTGADVINGNAGDDHMYGLQGNDTLAGGKGNDTVDGAEGNDTLSGGAGDDLLRAEPFGTEGSDDATDRADGGTHETSIPGDTCFVRARGSLRNCETIESATS